MRQAVKLATCLVSDFVHGPGFLQIIAPRDYHSRTYKGRDPRRVSDRGHVPTVVRRCVSQRFEYLRTNSRQENLVQHQHLRSMFLHETRCVLGHITNVVLGAPSCDRHTMDVPTDNHHHSLFSFASAHRKKKKRLLLGGLAKKFTSTVTQRKKTVACRNHWFVQRADMAGR